MRLSGVPTLRLSPETGVWYRAVRPRFLRTALATGHTSGISSRYNAGRLAAAPFEVLYLAENHLVALFEVQALFGSPTTPVPNPAGSWVIINARVQLSAVADLTLTSEQRKLRTNAQTLTGDWAGYHLRSPGTSVTRPTGVPAPTQELGQAISDNGGIEGIRAISAKIPYSMALVIFPDRLKSGSYVEYTDPSDPSFKPIRIP